MAEALALASLEKPVPVQSGMSFDLDVGPEPRTSYLLSVPGNTAVVALGGLGEWTVEVLASYDGLTFQAVGAHSLPGEWRYPTKGVVTTAIRVGSYTSGVPVAQLQRGGIAPVTSVSPLFGSYLSYAFRTGTTEPTGRGEIKFNATLIASVTKVWITNDAEDGSDQYHAVRRIPPGGLLMVQDRNTHLTAVLFRVIGPVVEKGLYAEVPVVYQEHTGQLSPQGKTPCLVAAFNPGSVLTLVPPGLVDKIDNLEPEGRDG